MKYTPSINIEQSRFNAQSYIVTPNVLGVVGKIVSAFNVGIHSFNIIGSYGTGKSNFILALEDSLKNKSELLLKNNGQFNGYKKFIFAKIVGDYCSLQTLLNKHLFSKMPSNNLFENLDSYFSLLNQQKCFVFIVIDEFGKLLEYAAKNNPEKELYLLQKFTEYINSDKCNAIFLTTLHQNFSSYARGLSDGQRQEWNKVKGRFKEIVFNEPVEQLLLLAAKRLDNSNANKVNTDFVTLYELAKSTRFISSSVNINTAIQLCPLDIFAAQALTLSIQRYGQNERTLFSFLEATDEGSLQAFKPEKNTYYSLANVYDYDLYNFYSYLNEANADTSAWTGMRVAIERVEGLLHGEDAQSAIKLVKTIGMINLFGNAGVNFSKNNLVQYATQSLGIKNAEKIINLLTQHKIIRYAEYKSQYILFEGTDVNLEGELLKASGIVPRSRDIISKLSAHFNLPYEFANASYFKTGTPRYFEYVLSDTPINHSPQNEIDGFINLIFNEELSLDKIKEQTANISEAILYAYFRNTNEIVDHIWQLDKLAYLQSIIDSNDQVAQREINSLIQYEQNLLNASVLNVLFNESGSVVWIFQGNEISIASKTDFNKKLSQICDIVYHSTPTIINEMINKHKPSSAMALARINYTNHLLMNVSDANLGFDDTAFKPEKTIYLTLLKSTGMHRRYLGTYELCEPQDESFTNLWHECELFLNSTKEKPRKLGELINTLKKRPYKIKQGILDFWIPTFLIIKKNDFSLYNEQGIFIPTINREILDLLQKSPNGFQMKAFNVEGVKLDLFNKYREALNMSQDAEFTTNSLIDTIKPFLIFYKKLNKYTQQTKHLRKTTLQFRDALAKAKDPEKTFFEDLPHALGFKETDIANNESVLKSYVELLQGAIRELRSCYGKLITRIEHRLIDNLYLQSSDYQEYKIELENRYACVKTFLLEDKQKSLFNRIMSESADRISWYQSLAYVIMDKPLESLLDEDEEYLINNLVFYFKDLEKYVDLQVSETGTHDAFIRFEMISNKGIIEPQIVRLDIDKLAELENFKQKLNELLDKNRKLADYALLDILKDRFSNNES